MFTKKTSLIIPTKDRGHKLVSLLIFLKKLKIKFNEIIIVDSSNIEEANKIKKFFKISLLRNKKCFCSNEFLKFVSKYFFRKEKAYSITVNI